MTAAICLTLAAVLGALLDNWRLALLLAAVIALATSPFTTATGIAAGVVLARRRLPP